MQKTGRDFVYSLSPGGRTLKAAQEVSRVADMYRITGDWHDCVSVKATGFRWNCTGRADFGRPGLQEHFTNMHVVESMIGVDGSFPDLDALTPYLNASDDRDFRLQMSFWAITRSPLFYGADIRSPDLTADDFKLLTNREVLKVNEGSSHNRQISATPEGAYVWAAQAPKVTSRYPELYVGLFNIGERPQRVGVSFRALGVSAGARCKAMDLWTGAPVGLRVPGEVGALLPPRNGAELYRLECS